MVIGFGSAAGENNFIEATCCLALSMACRLARPRAWLLDGLPKKSRKNGSMTSATRGSTGVVAL